VTNPSPARKTSPWLILIGTGLAIVVALGIVGAVVKPSAGQTPPATTSTAPSADTRIADFEDQNEIDISDWYGHIKAAQIEGSALWVYTNLSETSTAKELASSICGAYSLYTLKDESVTVVFVRAGSGVRLAKCGPGA
jgi:hypothetical protein